MGLADGYVPPKWKDKDWKVRLKAVKELDDQKILTEIAQKDSNNRVRVEAFKRITDKSAILARMNTRDDLYQDIRERVMIFDDKNVLEFIAKYDSDSKIRMKAAKKSKNTYLIDTLNKEEEKKRKKQELLDECVDEIVMLYMDNPDGFLMGSSRAEPLRDIGKKLNEAGGFDMMLQAHSMATRRGVNSRNLEMVWDHIGSWYG